MEQSEPQAYPVSSLDGPWVPVPPEARCDQQVNMPESYRKKKQKEIEQSARDCSCKTCISMKMSMQYEDYEEMAQYEDYEALVQFENNKVLPAR